MPDQLSPRRAAAARARFVRGLDLARRGRAASAERAFSAGLALDPRSAYGLLYRACLRLLAGDRRGAGEDFDAALAVPAADYSRYRELDAPPPSVYPRFERAVLSHARATRRPFAFVAAAFAARAGGRYAGAIGLVRRAAALAPRHAGLRALLGRVRFVGRLPPAALADLEAAARLDPSCAWIEAWRGEALRHLGRLPEALRAFQRATALDPACFRARAWRGAVLLRLGRPREALAELDASLAVDREYWWGLRPGGRSADSNLAWALNQRALALAALGRAREHFSALKEAHRLNARWTCVEDALLDRRARVGDPWARAWRGLRRLETGRAGEALADLERAASALPREALPAAWRARALLVAGRAGDARRESVRALRLDPLYAPAWGWRGAIARAEADAVGALKAFDRALELDPTLAWCWAWRGECLLALRLRAPARESLRRALALDPSNGDARAWLRRARG